MACERYSENPMVAPIFSPNERLMMKYSPPPSTRRFVAISEMAIAVGIVTKCARIMTRIVPYGPIVPTENPNRRNRMAPRIVAMLVKNTGAVPNDFLFCCIKVTSKQLNPGLKLVFLM